MTMSTTVDDARAGVPPFDGTLAWAGLPAAPARIAVAPVSILDAALPFDPGCGQRHRREGEACSSLRTRRLSALRPA
jgi:hypothetical protein